jgi:WD40 repeat protein
MHLLSAATNLFANALVLAKRLLTTFAIITAAMTVGCGKPTTEPKQGKDKSGSAPIVPRISLDTGGEHVQAVAVSADGKRVAVRTSTKSKNVQVWDLDKKAKIREFDDDSGNAVALSPDGKIVAYAKAIGQVMIVDVATGNKLHEMSMTNNAQDVQFSPSGELVAATGSHDVRCWIAATGKIQFEWSEARMSDTTLSPFFEEGKKIATNGKEKGKVVSILDVTSGKLLQELPVGEHIYAIGVSADGKRIAASSIEGIKIWELPGAKVIKTIDSPSARAMLLLPDGKTLAYRKEKDIILEDVDSGARRVLAGHKGDINHNGLAVTPDGKVLVSGSDNDNSLKVWDIK